MVDESFGHSDVDSSQKRLEICVGKWVGKSKVRYGFGIFRSGECERQVEFNRFFVDLKLKTCINKQ